MQGGLNPTVLHKARCQLLTDRTPLAPLFVRLRPCGGDLERRRAAKPQSAAPPLLALVDSGPLLIALFDRADRWHLPVLEWLRTHQAVRLQTTWPVLTEVCALLANRNGNDAALDFLGWVHRGALEIDRPDRSTLGEVLAISRRFADLPFDLIDASIAKAAARLVHHV